MVDTIEHMSKLLEDKEIAYNTAQESAERARELYAEHLKKLLSTSRKVATGEIQWADLLSVQNNELLRLADVFAHAKETELRAFAVLCHTTHLVTQAGINVMLEDKS